MAQEYNTRRRSSASRILVDASDPIDGGQYSAQDGYDALPQQAAPRTQRDAYYSRDTYAPQPEYAPDAERPARSAYGTRGAQDPYGTTRSSERAQRPRYDRDAYGSEGGSDRSSRGTRDTRSGRSSRTAETARGTHSARGSRDARSSRGSNSTRSSSSRSANRSAGNSARRSTRGTVRGNGTGRGNGIGAARGGRNGGNRGGGAIAALSSLPFAKIILAIVLLVVIVFGARMCMSMIPITVTINGGEYTIHGAKTVQTAAQECGLPLNPGDLISLQGNVLERFQGEPYSVTVNGEKVTDYSMRLSNGDVIQLGDGDDIVEEYEATQQPIPRYAEILGYGSLHIISDPGSDGILETRVGKLSGETVEKRLQEPDDVTVTEFNPITSQKVIALTFDDGPSEYTPEVLDLLKQYDAKATFFVVGTCIEEEDRTQFTERAAQEGHQILTHTYSHALSGNSVNLATCDPDDQVGEIANGYTTIKSAIGSEPEHILRLPGGYLDEDLLLNIYPYFEIEVGWNIDTADWMMPGEEEIADSILAAESGDIVLCHDGGGDRSQTVEALKIALPKLKAEGYRLVTLDELLAVCTNSELSAWHEAHPVGDAATAASGSAAAASVSAASASAASTSANGA